jgi:asparagine synthase (glutamine-hydrolysing)
MCGIAGQLSLRPDVDVRPEDVQAMTRALVHRGPDDDGFFLDSRRRVALGMRRLAVIDLHTGHQPISNEDESVVCILNGEIYNFKALRDGLEHRGHQFRSATDTEVLVHLYEDEGAHVVNHLRGMFALAIWDARKELLLLARDRLGKKPLYYATVHDRLVFASELAALCQLDTIPRDVDLEALDLYLTHSYIPSPYSIYRGVRKLPPAHCMIIRNGAIDIRQYWRLQTSPAWSDPAEELTAQLRAKLADAVRIRLVSDVPLGCFLSGGTDSSSIVALMSEASPSPVKTYSIGFSDESFNELKYARVVASRYRTDHHEFIVQPDALAVLPDIVRHFGEPFGDSSAVPTWYVSQMARRHVTVALNGDGGDELFGGYPWYRTASGLDALTSWLPRPLGAALARLPLIPTGRAQRLLSRLRMSPAARYASLRVSQTPAVRHRLYTDELASRCGSAASQYLIDAYEQADGEPLARMQYTDILTYLPEDLLVKVDRMSMAHSLEARSPLLDHELLEFAVRIPSAMKASWRGGKLILCAAMRDRFPPRFLERPKMGFSIPVMQWLRNDLREECYKRICGGMLGQTGWFNPDALRVLVDEHVSGERDWSAQVWNLLILGIWTELFL